MSRARRTAGAPLGLPGAPSPARLAVAVGLLAVGGVVLAAGAAAQAPTVDQESSGVSSTTSTAPPAGGGTAITSRLVVDGQALEGVKVTATREGRSVDATSGADGTVRLEVPGPGRYEVRLDPATLPEGIVPAPDAPEVLRPIAREGIDSPVVFRLQRAGAADTREEQPNQFLGLVASGLRFGLVIALAAVGLSLLYGTTGLTNFAHGELVTFGAVATWYVNNAGVNLWLAVPVGVVLGGLFGALLETSLFRPLRRRRMPVLSVMVVSIGLAFLLRYLISLVFGAGPRQYQQYAAQSPTVDLGPINVRPVDVIIVVTATLALVVVGVFLQRSRLGTAIRAVSDDVDLAASSGIDVQRVILTVWIMSGAMAGLAGVMLGATDTITWNMGQRVLLVMFAAVVLGGLGTAFGAMAGGLVVGIVSDVSTYWLDADLKIVVALAALVVVLLFRPQGIFGVRARAA